METARVAEFSRGGDGIGFTNSADAAITLENLFAEIGGLGAQFPLVHAEL